MTIKDADSVSADDPILGHPKSDPRRKCRTRRTLLQSVSVSIQPFLAPATTNPTFIARSNGRSSITHGRRDSRTKNSNHQPSISQPGLQNCRLTTTMANSSRTSINTYSCAIHTPSHLSLTPLRLRTKIQVACFPDATGYALGTVEGRVAIQHIDDKAAASNFTFKCHRKDNPAPSKSSTVYAVNDISFHPYGSFSTCGSDGTVNVWDKERFFLFLRLLSCTALTDLRCDFLRSKTRLKTFDNKGGPIVSTGFNHTGRIFAYAVTQGELVYDSPLWTRLKLASEGKHKLRGR